MQYWNQGGEGECARKREKPKPKKDEMAVETESMEE